MYTKAVHIGTSKSPQNSTKRDSVHKSILYISAYSKGVIFTWDEGEGSRPQLLVTQSERRGDGPGLKEIRVIAHLGGRRMGGGASESSRLVMQLSIQVSCLLPSLSPFPPSLLTFLSCMRMLITLR